MGVWIETDRGGRNRLSVPSHPVWVCGLKLFLEGMRGEALSVTPCMGVWIETAHKHLIFKVIKVTPCMGVWIETRYYPQSLLLS